MGMLDPKSLVPERPGTTGRVSHGIYFSPKSSHGVQQEQLPHRTLCARMGIILDGIQISALLSWARTLHPSLKSDWRVDQPAVGVKDSGGKGLRIGAGLRWRADEGVPNAMLLQAGLQLAPGKLGEPGGEFPIEEAKERGEAQQGGWVAVWQHLRRDHPRDLSKRRRD